MTTVYTIVFSSGVGNREYHEETLTIEYNPNEPFAPDERITRYMDTRDFVKKFGNVFIASMSKLVDGNRVHKQGVGIRPEARFGNSVTRSTITSFLNFVTSCDELEIIATTNSIILALYRHTYAYIEETLPRTAAYPQLEDEIGKKINAFVDDASKQNTSNLSSLTHLIGVLKNDLYHRFETIGE